MSLEIIYAYDFGLTNNQDRKKLKKNWILNSYFPKNSFDHLAYQCGWHRREHVGAGYKTLAKTLKWIWLPHLEKHKILKNSVLLLNQRFSQFFKYYLLLCFSIPKKKTFHLPAFLWDL